VLTQENFNIWTHNFLLCIMRHRNGTVKLEKFEARVGGVKNITDAHPHGCERLLRSRSWVMYRQIEPNFRTIRIHMARVSIEEGNSRDLPSWRAMDTVDGGFLWKVADKCRCARPTRKLTRKSNIPSSRYGKSHMPHYRRKCNYRPMHLKLFVKTEINEK